MAKLVWFNVLFHEMIYKFRTFLRDPWVLFRKLLGLVFRFKYWAEMLDKMMNKIPGLSTTERVRGGCSESRHWLPGRWDSASIVLGHSRYKNSVRILGTLPAEIRMNKFSRLFEYDKFIQTLWDPIPFSTWWHHSIKSGNSRIWNSETRRAQNRPSQK